MPGVRGPSPGEAIVVAWFDDREPAEAALADVRAWVPDARGAFEEAPETDWSTAWRCPRIRSTRMGRLWVGPPWEAPPEGTVPLVIEPKMAFGTETIPRRSCAWPRWMRSAPRHPGASVLDVGTGTGVPRVMRAKARGRARRGRGQRPDVGDAGARERDAERHRRRGAVRSVARGGPRAVRPRCSPTSSPTPWSSSHRRWWRTREDSWCSRASSSTRRTRCARRSTRGRDVRRRRPERRLDPRSTSACALTCSGSGSTSTFPHPSVFASRDRRCHHLRVARVGPGETVEVFDGRGRAWIALLESMDGSGAVLRLGDLRPAGTGGPWC